MTRNYVWIKQEICGIKLYIYRSNIQSATTIYFLDGEQFKEIFCNWIIEHEPVLNFVLIDSKNRSDDYTPWPLQ